MTVDYSRRYESSDSYFNLAGSAVMTLTPEAAVGVCREAIVNGLIVIRFEGGIWRDDGSFGKTTEDAVNKEGGRKSLPFFVNMIHN